MPRPGFRCKVHPAASSSCSPMLAAGKRLQPLRSFNANKGDSIVPLVQGEMFTRPGILVDAFPSWAPEDQPGLGLIKTYQDPLKDLKQMIQLRVEVIECSECSGLYGSRSSFDRQLYVWTC